MQLTLSLSSKGLSTPPSGFQECFPLLELSVNFISRPSEDSADLPGLLLIFMRLYLLTAYSTDGVLNIFPSLTAANTGLPLEEALVDIDMSNCPLFSVPLF